MAREYLFPLGMCDLHLEELHDLRESGEVSYMLERVKEWKEGEREECDYCSKIAKESELSA